MLCDVFNYIAIQYAISYSKDSSNKTQSRLDVPDLAVMSVIHVVSCFFSVNVFLILSLHCMCLNADVYESSIYRINTFLICGASFILNGEKHW